METNTSRRSAILGLLSGAVAGLALLAARRGFTGAGKWAARLGKPVAAKAETKYYGYDEVKLS